MGFCKQITARKRPDYHICPEALDLAAHRSGGWVRLCTAQGSALALRMYKAGKLCENNLTFKLCSAVDLSCGDCFSEGILWIPCYIRICDGFARTNEHEGETGG